MTESRLVRPNVFKVIARSRVEAFQIASLFVSVSDDVTVEVDCDRTVTATNHNPDLDLVDLGKDVVAAYEPASAEERPVDLKIIDWRDLDPTFQAQRAELVRRALIALDRAEGQGSRNPELYTVRAVLEHLR